MALPALIGALLVAPSGQAAAQAVTDEAVATYADLADLADQSQLVVRAVVKRQARLEAERAPGLAPGFTRLYIEAETLSLIAGSAPIGESLRYLVDVPLDEKGRAPKLKKREFVLFARTVPNRPGELQLVDTSAQFDWSATLAARLRPILSGLVASDTLPEITGVRDALSVEGNLAGESETQLFLETASGSPVSITVLRRPGMPRIWGVSRSEIVDQAARPPAPNTVDWYRLACFLPREIPREAFLTADNRSSARAREDYEFVRAQLGPCERNRS